MSDPKRATLITVGATKDEKNKVNKTVRLSINLDESNESKYPELNYKDLVIAQVRKKVVAVENGKTQGLNPYSDNDEDVERVARKFEQKYGGNSTYGKKGKSKHDDFADIGAGYDENDSFIDNTDGYDEMIPPECETFYGGFYINSGLLEFKNADNQSRTSDGDVDPGGRNKRRISSSSSEDDSSESSSESDSQDEKDPKAMVNGTADSHKQEHRKKKNKKHDNKQAKKIRRTDSSAATSGKHTSDDNGHGDGESADSRTSQSDSLASKPAPSSENAITSDSSRDMEAKVEVSLPPAVSQKLEELEAAVSLQLIKQPGISAADMERLTEEYVVRLDSTLSKWSLEPRLVRLAWSRCARALATSRTRLMQRVRALTGTTRPADVRPRNNASAAATSNPAQSSHHTTAQSSKRKMDDMSHIEDASRLTDEEREDKIVETLQKLKALIEERKPGMMASYNAECERVQEERKKLQIAADGAPYVEKRLPKRRFPWCPRSRALLGRLRALAGGRDAAAALLARRALPLFPRGFVRMPTLLRQADLSKEIKAADLKRQRRCSPPAPAAVHPVHIADSIPIHFPSSLTVTTTAIKTSPEKTEAREDKTNSVFGNIVNTYSLNKDLLEMQEERESVIVVDKKEDLYIPPNNIGCITITPVPSNQTKPCPDKKVNNATDKHKEGLIRVKSPAALNEMVNKKEKEKALENIHKREKEKEKALENIHKREKEKEKALENIHKREKDKLKAEKTHSLSNKDKRVDTPLQIDVSYQPKQKEPTPSPKSKVEEITKKQIETMRVAENNIPRPALVPVHHSPTFAKPDKRPPEVKKKKDLVIVSDLDPLGDIQSEPVAVDDSSSDVELVEDTKSDKPCEKQSDSVPSRDKVSVRENHMEVDSGKHSNDSGKHANESGRDTKKDERNDKSDEAMKEDFNSLMKNLRDLENSQEPKFTSSSYGGVITSAAKHDKSSSQSSFGPRGGIFGQSRSDKDKFTERASLNKMDGCSSVTG